jgi:hypothetical protein
VQNGSQVTGRASAIKSALANDGFSSSLISVGSAATTAATALYYPSGRSDSAAAVAGALGIPASAVHQSGNYTEVTVVIGTDWTSGTTFGSASTGGSAAGTAPDSQAVASSPPAASLATNAGDDKACMVVPNPEW